MSAADDVLAAIAAGKPEPTPATRIATTVSYTASGVIVRFDGESVDSARRYPRLTSWVPRSPERVLMIRSGSTWVCAGRISTGTPPDDHVPSWTSSLTTATAVATGTWTTLSLGTSIVAHPSMTSFGGGVLILEPGRYMMSGVVMFRKDSSAGMRAASVYAAGNYRSIVYAAPLAALNDNVSAVVPPTLLDLVYGDVVELRAYQSSGVSVTVEAGIYTQLSVVHL